LSGVDGTAGGRRYRAQFLRNGGDVPLMVVAVGSGEQISMALPQLGEMRHAASLLMRSRQDRRLVPSRLQARAVTTAITATRAISM
jgi:hypothetical protein